MWCDVLCGNVGGVDVDVVWGCGVVYGSMLLLFLLYDVSSTNANVVVVDD